MPEVLLYLQRPGKTLPEKQASPRSGFPSWIFSFYKNLFYRFCLKVLDFLAHCSSLLLSKSIPNIFPKYPQDIHKMKFTKSLPPKGSQNYTYDTYSQGFHKPQEKITTFNISIYMGEFKSAWHACTLFCLPSLFLFFSRGKNIPKILPKYPKDIPQISQRTQNIPKISPRYSHFL